MPIQNFDTTLHESEHWLEEVQKELQYKSEHDAYHALRAVLHTLRDHLPQDTSMHFAKQLPMLLKGLYFEGWHGAAPENVDRTEFLEEIKAHLKKEDYPERVFHGVMKVITKHTGVPELYELQMVLPKDVTAMMKEEAAS